MFRVGHYLLALYSLLLSATAAGHAGVDREFGNLGVVSFESAVSGLLSTAPDWFHGSIYAYRGKEYWYVFASDPHDYRIRRFDATGQPDVSFRADGDWTQQFQSLAASRPIMGIDDSGRILLAGATVDSSTRRLQLARLSSSGAPDVTFGTSGYLSIILPNTLTDRGVIPVYPKAIVPREGGGFFVFLSSVAIVAVDETGRVDTSIFSGGFLFGTSAIVGGQVYQEHILAVTGYGAVYAVRWDQTGAKQMLRYLPTGALDLTYGNGGFAALPAGPWGIDNAFLLADESMLIGSSRNTGDNSDDLAVWKFDRTGRIVTAFGSAGRLSVRGRNQSGPNAYYGYRVIDVGRDGSLLVMGSLSHYGGSTMKLMLFDGNGNIVKEFGGKGVTRIPLQAVDTNSFYSLNARFDDQDGVLVLGVGGANADGMLALRLKRVFQHSAELRSSRTAEYSYAVAAPKSQFQYGDNILVDTELVGDAGKPDENIMAEVGQWRCSVELGSSPQLEGRVGCTVWAETLGTYTWRLRFLGDEIYGQSEMSGAPISVAKRNLQADLTFTDRSALLKDYWQTSVRWSWPSNSSFRAAPLTGVTVISAGGSKCEAPIDQYQGGTCHQIAQATGRFPVLAEFANDPYYVGSPTEVATIEIRPAQKFGAIGVGMAESAILSIDGTDPGCGLKSFGYLAPYESLVNLPRPNAALLARNGGYWFETVPGCDKNTRINVSIEYPFPLGDLAELWFASPIGTSAQSALKQIAAQRLPRGFFYQIANDSDLDSRKGDGTIGSHAILFNPAKTLVEYVNTRDFPDSPGGHYFYTGDPAEQAILDGGSAGAFVRTGHVINAGGNSPACRFYGSVNPGPNSHFYTSNVDECRSLRSMQSTPVPQDRQQWNYEGVGFMVTPHNSNQGGASGCRSGTRPVYRAYNNAFTLGGNRNRWDSNHRYTTDSSVIATMVAQGWRDEGVVFCSVD